MDVSTMEHEHLSHAPEPVEDDPPPRPLNAFMIYRGDKLKELSRENEEQKLGRQSELSKVIGSMWRQETQEARKGYYNRALQEKLVFDAKYPNYKYRPKKKKGKSRATSRRSKKASPPAHASHTPSFVEYPPLSFNPLGQHFSPSISTSSSASTPPISWSPSTQGSSGPMTPPSSYADVGDAPFRWAELEKRFLQENMSVIASHYAAAHNPYAFAANGDFIPDNQILQHLPYAGQSTAGFHMGTATQPRATCNVDEMSGRPRKKARLPPAHQTATWSNVVPHTLATQAQRQLEPSFDWNTDLAPLDAGFCDFATVLQRTPGPSPRTHDGVHPQASPSSSLARPSGRSSLGHAQAPSTVAQTGSPTLHVPQTTSGQLWLHDTAISGLALPTNFDFKEAVLQAFNALDSSTTTGKFDSTTPEVSVQQPTMGAQDPSVANFTGPYDHPTSLDAGPLHSPTFGGSGHNTPSPSVELAQHHLDDRAATVPRSTTWPVSVVDVTPPTQSSSERAVLPHANTFWQAASGYTLDSAEMQSWFDFPSC
ncbi:hypothetical protein OH77DRAFT_280575 [Trametes cingulata]|nr:hypothetical protein OH77DRAFT_280575 [Trametes cingulata]